MHICVLQASLNYILVMDNYYLACRLAGQNKLLTWRLWLEAAVTAAIAVESACRVRELEGGSCCISCL